MKVLICGGKDTVHLKKPLKVPITLNVGLLAVVCGLIVIVQVCVLTTFFGVAIPLGDAV